MEGYNYLTKRVFLRKQLKPKALGLLMHSSRSILMVVILALVLISCRDTSLDPMKLYIELGEYEKALELINDQLESSDSHFGHYYAQGYCFAALNRDSLACDSYLKGMELFMKPGLVAKREYDPRYISGMKYLNSSMMDSAEYFLGLVTKDALMGKGYRKQARFEFLFREGQ